MSAARWSRPAPPVEVVSRWAADRAREVIGDTAVVSPVRVVDAVSGAGVVVEPWVSPALAGSTEVYVRSDVLLRSAFSREQLRRVAVMIAAVDVCPQGSFRQSVLLRVWGSLGDVLVRGVSYARSSSVTREVLSRNVGLLCSDERVLAATHLWLRVCASGGVPPQVGEDVCAELAEGLAQAPPEVWDVAEGLSTQWCDTPERWVEAAFALCDVPLPRTAA